MSEDVGMYKVFVYGSLKMGYGNHHILSSSKFLGNDLTKHDMYRMFSFGGFPGVIESPGQHGTYISGEVYEVDEETMKKLDILESNGFFYKREIVELSYWGNAWMYLTIHYDDSDLDYLEGVEVIDGVSQWKL